MWGCFYDSIRESLKLGSEALLVDLPRRVAAWTSVELVYNKSSTNNNLLNVHKKRPSAKSQGSTYLIPSFSIWKGELTTKGLGKKAGQRIVGESNQNWFQVNRINLQLKFSVALLFSFLSARRCMYPINIFFSARFSFLCKSWVFFATHKVSTEASWAALTFTWNVWSLCQNCAAEKSKQINRFDNESHQ